MSRDKEHATQLALQMISARDDGDHEVARQLRHRLLCSHDDLVRAAVRHAAATQQLDPIQQEEAENAGLDYLARAVDHYREEQGDFSEWVDVYLRRCIAAGGLRLIYTSDETPGLLAARSTNPPGMLARSDGSSAGERDSTPG